LKDAQAHPVVVVLTEHLQDVPWLASLLEDLPILLTFSEE
jgi:hypothetical protein